MTMDVMDLQVAFYAKKHTLKAIESINFSLKPGQTMALLGESGSGKSLTALALMRLLPSYGVYGMQSKVLLDHQDLLNLPEYLMQGLRGRRIALIFQEPMTALNPVLRVDTQLKEVLSTKESDSLPMNEQLVDLLETVEISDPIACLNKYPHELSGGQKQRIMIAMALANNPEILVADEPTTALDVRVQAQILKLLKKLQKKYHMGLLLITHDLGVARYMADMIYLMYAGELIEVASNRDFFSHPKHPYAQQLMACLPSFDKRSHYLPAIAGTVPSLDAMPKGCRFHPRCLYAFSRCKTEVPIWQTINGQKIRCHLYPERALQPLCMNEQRGSFDNSSGDVFLKTDNELLLTVKNCQIVFKSGGGLRKQVTTLAVEDISLSVYRGKTLALVGESGSGKTSVARAILQFTPLASGEIMYRGKLVNRLNGKALRAYRKRVQMIFQDPYSAMNPRLTVDDILAEGMIANGFSAKQIRIKQHDLLDKVQLPHNSLTRFPHEFSGGQRQRICIARALAMDPDILICDEPTSALDISVQAQILNLLKELQSTFGISYVIITHNMSVVSYLADEVIVMRKGRVVEHNTVFQILNHPQNSYTRELLNSVF